MLIPSRHFRRLCSLSLSIAAHAAIVQALGTGDGPAHPDKPARPPGLRVSMVALPVPAAKPAAVDLAAVDVAAVDVAAVDAAAADAASAAAQAGSRPAWPPQINSATATLQMPSPAAIAGPGAASAAAASAAAASTPAPAAALLEIPTPSEPYYFKTSELAEKPQVVADLPADFALLLSGEYFQSAIVRLLINEAGEVDDVIFDTSNFSENNQRLIREAVSKMRFTPGRFDDVAVKSEMRIEIALDGAGR